jgi:trans-2,3-dihydro-3-hydroxyanthranilate isomerase
VKYNYFITDVFTKQLFSGAQIAVFPKAEGLSSKQMALLAAELNLSETVFVLPPDNDNATHKMRIFTPQGEIDFAGHPIIATAFVLAACGEIQVHVPNVSLVLEQNTGLINTNVTSQNGKPTFVQFTQTFSSSVDCFAPTDQELASFLNINSAEIDSNKYSVKLVSCGFPYLIVPVLNYETIRNARFGFDAWSESTAPHTTAQEILLFSPNNQYHDSDFHLRLLGPNIAVKEDPPVGSAIPAFAAYLCSHEHIEKKTHTFALDRGDENSRYSVLGLEMENKGESLLTIRVGGDAVMVAEGKINIE